MMEHSLIDYIIGGGLISLVLALLTLRSQVRKVRAEANKFELTNSEKATEILVDNIVQPLKQELHETRRELSLLRNALHEATRCRYSNDCPVLLRLQQQSNDNRPAAPPTATS